MTYPETVYGDRIKALDEAVTMLGESIHKAPYASERILAVLDLLRSERKRHQALMLYTLEGAIETVAQAIGNVADDPAIMHTDDLNRWVTDLTFLAGRARRLQDHEYRLVAEAETVRVARQSVGRPVEGDEGRGRAIDLVRAVDDVLSLVEADTTDRARIVTAARVARLLAGEAIRLACPPALATDDPSKPAFTLRMTAERGPAFENKAP